MPDLITVGHVLTDIRLYIDAFPKPDGEAKVEKLIFGGGGSAANVAVGASRLGVKTGFIGAIGFDTFGQVLLQELRNEGVDVNYVKVDTTQNSGLTIVAVNRHGQVKMFGFTGASDQIFPQDLNKSYISSAEHIHITGLSFNAALSVANMAREAKITVSFDPGRLMSILGLERISPLLKSVDQILLNHEESKELTGKDDLDAAAKTLLKAGPKIVIIKRGADGVFGMTREIKFKVPAQPVDVVDTTGAGDAFSAGFITAQLEGKDLKEMVEFATQVAGLKIMKMGARALPTRKDVERFLRHSKMTA